MDKKLTCAAPAVSKGNHYSSQTPLSLDNQWFSTVEALSSSSAVADNEKNARRLEHALYVLVSVLFSFQVTQSTFQDVNVTIIHRHIYIEPIVVFLQFFLVELQAAWYG